MGKGSTMTRQAQGEHGRYGLSVIAAEDRQELGKLVKGLRHSRGMSQAELARQSGVSETQLSRLQDERYPDLIGPDKLDALAAALGVEPSLLHRAYAASVGLRIETHVIEDGALSEVIALWPDMEPADREAFRAAARAFIQAHRRATGED